MLKLAEYKCYGDLITREQFQALALLMNVSTYVTNAAVVQI